MTRGLLAEAALQMDLPAYMVPSLIEYLMTGRPVGDFMSSVLTNDLKKACAHADDVNAKCIYLYVKFLWNWVPVGAWGSTTNYNEWIKKGGWEGIQATAREKVKDEISGHVRSDQ